MLNLVNIELISTLRIRAKHKYTKVICPIQEKTVGPTLYENIHPLSHCAAYRSRVHCIGRLFDGRHQQYLRHGMAPQVEFCKREGTVAHLALGRQLCEVLLQTTFVFTSNWMPGESNVVADKLSCNFDLSPKLLTAHNNKNSHYRRPRICVS
jgi:hypothetical protein